MKRTTKISAILLGFTLLLNACSSTQQIVGQGAQGTSYSTAWNHHMVFGLVANGLSNPEKMAGSAQNYTVTTKHTFVNGLLAVLTLGMYTPSQTTVTR